jgi:heterotetrameric sarcosine oxidase gamma subunit
MAPAGDVIVLDLWAGTLPSLDPAIRALPVEPRRWWLIDAAPHADAIAATMAGNGALTPIGGGLVRATLTGPGWRELLTVSGCFDSESPGFAPGGLAATVIHHVPVWIAVTGDAACEVYLAASYAPTLAALWTTAIGAPPPPSLPRPGSA